MAPGAGKERDLSWLDWSTPGDISSDGSTILFTESGEGGGPKYAVFLRRTDGSPAVRLSEGTGVALSPDGKWAVVRPNTPPAPLMLQPTGVGESKVLFQDSINHLWTRWLPDGKTLVFLGNEPGHGFRLYVQSLNEQRPRPISPEGVAAFVVLSPKGDSVATAGPDGQTYLYPIAGGDPTVVQGVGAGEVPTGWSSDGKSIYVYRFGEIPAKVLQVDIATGKRQPWKQLVPADSAGIDTIRGVELSADGKSYVYGYIRTLSDLYLVEGVK